MCCGLLVAALVNTQVVSGRCLVPCLPRHGHLVDTGWMNVPDICSENGVLSFREPLVKMVALDPQVLRGLVGSLVSWVSLAPKVPM